MSFRSIERWERPRDDFLYEHKSRRLIAMRHIHLRWTREAGPLELS